ncbi:TIGR03943 family protein, partial [Moorena sp. SIO3I6]
DAYTGQKVKVDGFVVIAPNLPPDHLLISRFVITCCAADAYPLGLPVKLTENRNDYPSDTWIEVEGNMITETLDDKRQLVIEASGIKKIPEPENPYYY